MDKLRQEYEQQSSCEILVKLSTKEVARVLGLSIEAVKGRCTKAEEIAQGVEARVRLDVRETDLAGEAVKAEWYLARSTRRKYL